MRVLYNLGVQGEDSVGEGMNCTSMETNHRFSEPTLQKAVGAVFQIQKLQHLIDINRRIIRAYWPASITENANSRLSETLYLKRIQQSNRERPFPASEHE